MTKSVLLAIAVLALVWSAAAQSTPPSGVGAASPQTGAAQAPSQAPQNVPITPEGAGSPRNPQRGEDAGQQGERVPVAGQQPAQTADDHSLPANTPILAELSKTVDVKKAKNGDQVTARVIQDVLKEGNVVIPHGARLIGHITEAKPAGKGEDQSELGIAWDRAEMRNGDQVPLHADIQALAPRQELASSAPANVGMPSAQPGSPVGAGPMGGPPQGGGMGQPGQAGAAGTMGNPGGMGNPAGGESPEVGGVGSPTTMPTTGQRGGGGPALNARSSGVQGMPGVAVRSQSNAAQGSLIRDARGNLKLEIGTQLVLRVVAP